MGAKNGLAKRKGRKGDRQWNFNSHESYVHDPHVYVRHTNKGKKPARYAHGQISAPTSSGFVNNTLFSLCFQVSQISSHVWRQRKDAVGSNELVDGGKEVFEKCT